MRKIVLLFLLAVVASVGCDEENSKYVYTVTCYMGEDGTPTIQETFDHVDELTDVYLARRYSTHESVRFPIDRCTSSKRRVILPVSSNVGGDQ